MAITNQYHQISIFDLVAAPAPRYLMRLSLMQKLIEFLPKNINKFLEIGPGMGDLSLYLAQYFPEARGKLIEFSGQSIDILKKRMQHHARLKIIQDNFVTHYHKEKYDLIVACEVFEHIQDDNSALRTVSNILTPGGYFIFSAPAFMEKWQICDQFAGHYRRYEREEVIKKFSAHDLSIEKLWCYGFPITHMMYPLRQLYYGIKFRSQKISKEEATKNSGIERSIALRLKKLHLPILMQPFFILQHLVKNKNIGEGFLVLARKHL